jgi:trimethylamine---corrinoid protein Co-methyltransferase
VGPGGNFFAEKHTFSNFKKHLFFPELLNRSGFDKWQEAGGTSFEQRANQKVRSILENHVGQDLPKTVIANIKEIVARRDTEVNAQIGVDLD